MLNNYEPGGRGFESCRARHSLDGSGRVSPALQSLWRALGVHAAAILVVALRACGDPNFRARPPDVLALLGVIAGMAVPGIVLLGFDADRRSFQEAFRQAFVQGLFAHQARGPLRD